jgi:hypothetical protein
LERLAGEALTTVSRLADVPSSKSKSKDIMVT